MKWFVIRNPQAGKGAAIKQWPIIREALLRAGIEFEDCRTAMPNHAQKLARNAVAKGFRKFLALGGDGTVNEMVNGMVGQSYVDSSELTLAQWPIGRENNWSRILSLPKNLASFAKLMQKGATQTHDVGLINWQNERKESCQRYFIHNANMGFKAAVLKDLAYKKQKKGFAYLRSLFQSFRKYHTAGSHLQIDGKSQAHLKLFDLNLGLGLHAASSFQLTWIEQTSFWKILTNTNKQVPTASKNTHQFKGQNIEVQASEDTWIAVDGELLGQGEASFSLLSAQLQVLSS